MERTWEFLPGLIAMLLIAIFAFVMVMLMWFPMPMSEAAGTLATALVSALVTNIGMIVSYYFGSSKNSKEKDATIFEQAKTSAAASVAAAVNPNSNGKLVPPSQP